MLAMLWKNVCFTWALIFVLIQLFCAFGTLNGIELPLELMQQEGVNAAKSMDYARRMAFPLSTSDNGVELPPNVEDNMDLNGPHGFDASPMEDNDDLDEVEPMKSEMPKWLQMQLQPEQPQQHNNYHQHHSGMLTKHKPSSSNRPHYHHHDNRQIHSTTSAASSPLRRCSIEISSKIPGICQTMGSIGSACVSGDYIDVFNAECL